MRPIRPLRGGTPASNAASTALDRAGRREPPSSTPGSIPNNNPSVGLRLALLCSLLAWSSPADAAQRRYALVVGNSTSPTPGVRALEFADDDAARYAELLDGMADRVRLLTVLDLDA